MTNFLVLLSIFGGMALVAETIRRRLLVVGGLPTAVWDQHLAAARELLDPIGPHRAPGTAAIASLTATSTAPQLSRIAAGELTVLATAYLCAVHEGDSDRRRQILTIISTRELLAGLSLAARALAADHGVAIGKSTTSVLGGQYQDAVIRHRRAVIAA